MTERLEPDKDSAQHGGEKSQTKGNHQSLHNRWRVQHAPAVMTFGYHFLFTWAFPILGVIGGLLCSMGHNQTRDVGIWVVCSAVIAVVIAGACWVQNWVWELDERSEPPSPTVAPTETTVPVMGNAIEAAPAAAGVSADSTVPDITGAIEDKAPVAATPPEPLQPNKEIKSGHRMTPREIVNAIKEAPPLIAHKVTEQYLGTPVAFDGMLVSANEKQITVEEPGTAFGHTRVTLPIELPKHNFLLGVKTNGMVHVEGIVSQISGSQIELKDANVSPITK